MPPKKNKKVDVEIDGGDEGLELSVADMLKSANKKGKKANAFNPFANLGEEEEDEGPSQPSVKLPAKKDKKKAKKGDVDEAEEDMQELSIEDSKKPAKGKKAADSDEETSPKDVKPAGKKGKKAKKDEDYLASLAEVDAEMEEAAPAPEEKGGKKGKKGKKDEDYLKSLADPDAEEAEVAPAQPEKGGKKGKKGRKGGDDDYLASLAAADEEEAPAAPAPKKEKGGKKGKKSDADYLADLMEVEDETAEVKPKKEKPAKKEKAAAEEEDEVAESKSKDKKGKKDNKKGGKKEAAVDEDELLEALMKENEAKAPKPAEPAKEDGKKKKDKGKEKEKPASQPTQSQDASSPTVEGPEGEGAEGDDAEEAGAAEGAAKDKKKKKRAAPVKKERPVAAAVRALQEAVAKQKEEEERIRREEEERKKIEEEAERIRLEEIKKAEEEKKRKQEEKLARREDLKKQGLILSKKEKEMRAKAEAARRQLEAQGLIPSAPKGSAPWKKKKGFKKGPKQGDAEETQQQRDSASPPPEESDQKMETEEVEVVAPVEEERPRGRALVAEESEDEQEVADSWEDTLEEEDQPAKPAAPAPAAAAATTTAAPAKTETTTTTAAEKAPAAPAAAADESEEEEEESEEETSESESEEDSESGSDSESESESEGEAERRKNESRERRQKRMEEAMKARNKDDLRSPICCILGHVDTGKTKLLDKIRRTNVQEGEAGGITQQIGASYFPVDVIKSQTVGLKDVMSLDYKIPGLLIIDTPGHESFANLRSRGSGLCDIAILVVDIMHGLEPQTIESIKLLKQRRTPFIVALNKVDRLFGWKACPNTPIREALAKQNSHVHAEFDTRVKQTIGYFSEQGLNAALYYENPSIAKYVSLVPTSAITGEGIPDLLGLMTHMTQAFMSERLMYLTELQCTILEVKVVEGLGTTIDVILSNGVLREGDTIVCCGLNGPIVTTVRALLTPKPLREIRVKGEYVHHKEVRAAQGIKICAQDLDNAVAGSSLLVLRPGDDLEDLKEEIMKDLESMVSKVDRSGLGVYVQASTLGSLEALLQFLKDSQIPVSGINIGPVFKKDVIRASTMLERKPEYAVILAFDVKVDPDATKVAEEVGVKIFTAEIIYHLFDAFVAYMKENKEKRRQDVSDKAVFPCILETFPQYVFSRKDPIILGVHIKEGILKVGTPIVVPSRGCLELGKVSGIEINKKAVPYAKRGDQVAVKILPRSSDTTPPMVGRQFDPPDELVSKLTRESIDLLKENFKDDLEKEDWITVMKLKKILNIQ